MSIHDYEHIDHVRRIVGTAPPMSDEIREKVIALFRLGRQMQAAESIRQADVELAG